VGEEEEDGEREPEEGSEGEGGGSEGEWQKGGRRTLQRPRGLILQSGGTLRSRMALGEGEGEGEGEKERELEGS